MYTVCIARVNVYLPDELNERAKAAGLRISVVTQDALRSVLDAYDTDRWLDSLDRLPGVEVSHDEVIAAVDDARAELGADRDD